MNKYLNEVIEFGAKDAKIIDTKTIVTAPWTIFKCQYGCGRYGKRLCCPPYSPGYKQIQEIINNYKWGILFTLNDGNKVTDIAVKMAKTLFFDGYYKSIGFGSGPCRKCKECNINGCNLPGQTAPAMEACGIDVFATARQNGYKIQVLKDENSEIQNHFGLILVE